MSLSNLNPVACRIPPVTGANGSRSKVSNVNMVNRRAQDLPPLQVSKMEQPISQESVTSRRDMMQLTAASIGLVSLLFPASAEARPRNATMRQKIMDKLQHLREKAGFSKPKNESEENKPKVEEQDKKMKMKNGAEENKGKAKNGEAKKTVIETPLVPALPNILNGNIVETTLP